MILFKYAYIKSRKMANIKMRGHFSKSNKYLGNLPVTVRDIYYVTLVSVDNYIHRD